MRKLFTLAAAVLASLTMMAQTVQILNTNFTTWKEGAVPPENSGLSNSNTYILLDGENEVATVVGKSCKFNDTKNTPTSTGIEGYNTNKFRFGSSGNYLTITPSAKLVKGGKIRILVSSERANEADELGTVTIGETTLGTLHAWTAKATCDWQEFSIPKTIDDQTASITLTRTSNTMFVWGVVVMTNASTPLLDAITIAEVEATIDQENGKITAELPYGTNIADAIDAITAADVTLGGTAETYEIAPDRSKLTVSDGTNSKDYAFDLTVSTSVSTDATLKSLSVNGVEITLEADKYEYEIELEYAASVVAVCEENDAAATAQEPVYTAGKISITVKAQDNSTKEYIVNYTMLPAKKDLLGVQFEREIKGFITNGKIKVPYLAGSTQPAFVSATFNGADGEPTAVVDGDNLKVTGIDGLDSLYAIEYIAVSPASISFNTEITFDSTETYVYNVYGWDKAKGWKFAKKVEEAANKRVSEGKVLLYFALPAAKSVALVSGSAGARDVKIYVNGTASTVTQTAASNNSITLDLDTNTPNFILIESNQAGGDGGFIKMTVAKDETPTAINNTEAEIKATKVLRDGQVLILRDGKFFNTLGVEVK